MVWILALLRWFGRMVLALLSFFAIAIGWTAVLYAVNPWATAQSGEWPRHRPIVVSSGAKEKTRVILYRQLADETQKDPSLVPWPATPSGTAQSGRQSR
jgi:hypothetical protein